MVRLQDISTINAEKFPFLSDWDKKVRKNYELYQNLIDARTYQLQRVQRYILVHDIINLGFEISKRL